MNGYLCKAGLGWMLLLVSGGAAALEFAGGNLGAIPDNNPAGRDVTFVVSGVSSPLADVRVSMTLTHTFVGDLEAELISPGGVARRVIFGRTGRNAVGGNGNNDLGGTYVFSDRGRDWWAAVAAVTGVVPGGEFRASTAGTTANNLKTGGCTAPITFAFTTLAPAAINGTWTLHIADRANIDTGAISASSLYLLATSDAIFANGFDGIVRGSCVHAQFDYTGSNRSSYVLTRNTGGGPSGALTWFVRDNDGTTTGPERSFIVGISSDFRVGGDFDGDNVWDPATWTAGTPGRYHIRLSSRPASAPLYELDFGQIGDDPQQAGDYDGDGKADFAVYRAGATAGDPSFMVVKLSSNGTERIIPAGQNGNFASGGSDYTNDGKADVAVQSNAGGGTARFDIHDGTDGAIADTYIFGTPTDVIVTGNHSGNALADTTVVRGSGGSIVWTTHDTGTGTDQAAVNFGLSATDFVLSSDFDGDGLDDYAIWRPSATPGASIFSIRPSATTASPFDVPYGQNGDYPPANSRSH
jgi:subtilisin-like proprotein convertase family protein